MESLEGLQYIRGIAVKNQQYDEQEAQLRQNMQLKILPQRAPEVTQISVGVPIYLLIFVIMNLILQDAAGSALGYILSRIAHERVYVIYPINFVAAAPFTLLGILIIVIIVKCINIIRRKKILKKRSLILEENQRIAQQNEQIMSQNRQIQDQIMEIREKKEQLAQAIRQNTPWFPEAYLLVVVVDFVIQQIQTGRASSVQQAVIQYEAYRN